VQPVGTALAVDAGNRPGDEQPRPELLRLDLGPAGERLAGDAGGKAQVVLDLRAGPRLPAWSQGLEHERLQPLGGSVDRGGEPAGTGAHHHEVEGVLGVHRLGEPQLIGEHGRGGIAEHALPRGNHHGQLVSRQLEAGEEATGIRVGLRVEQPVGIAVARQEALKPEGIGPMVGADEHHSPLHVPDEAEPAQDERAHDDLTDVRLARHQPPEVGALHPHHPAVGPGTAAHQYLPVVEEIQLAGELPLAMHGEDVRLAVGPEIEDLDGSLEQEEEVDAPVAALEEQRTLGQPLLGAIGDDPRRHVGTEVREDLRVARIGVGWIDLGLALDAWRPHAVEPKEGTHLSQRSGRAGMSRPRHGTSFLARSPGTVRGGSQAKWRHRYAAPCPPTGSRPSKFSRIAGGTGAAGSLQAKANVGA